MKISFKGAHYPKDVVLHAVFFYVPVGVSYRDLEAVLAERGVTVDHVALNRRVVRYSPLIALAAKSRKRTVAGSWRMDETYIKIKGEWASVPCGGQVWRYGWLYALRTPRRSGGGHRLLQASH